MASHPIPPCSCSLLRPLHCSLCVRRRTRVFLLIDVPSRYRFAAYEHSICAIILYFPCTRLRDTKPTRFPPPNNLGMIIPRPCSGWACCPSPRSRSSVGPGNVQDEAVRVRIASQLCDFCFKTLTSPTCHLCTRTEVTPSHDLATFVKSRNIRAFRPSFNHLLTDDILRSTLIEPRNIPCT